MNEKLKKVISEALEIINEDPNYAKSLSDAVFMLLNKERRIGFFLTVFDLKDPIDEDCRSTAYCGDPGEVAMALGMEMIDDDDVRFVLNNAKEMLDQFNEDLPEKEKLK